MKTLKYNEFINEDNRNNECTPIQIWYSIQNGGDGSAYPSWFLTEKEADYDQEHMSEGWGESCIGMVETYVGSNIHRQAVRNSRQENWIQENKLD